MEQKIQIRFAEVSDFEVIHAFLKEHWDADHIFVHQPELMAYQHITGDKLNFIIAEDKTDKKLYGMLGYIRYSQKEDGDVTPFFFKTIKSSRTMLGIEMMVFLREASKARVFLSCGVRPKTLPIYKYLRWPVGTLNHYYRLSDKESYKVAKVSRKEILPVGGKGYCLQHIQTSEEIKKCFKAEQYKMRKPYKDMNYIIHRYFNHPVYTYKVYGIRKDETVYDSILITREIECNGVTVLRIADFIGKDEDLKHIGGAIQQLMDANQYEYVEFYNYGISSEIMREAGFSLEDKQKEVENNIIPSHFEPFEQTNVVHHFFTTDMDGLYVFKGDSDQDTPRRADKE